jgi:hypothetical protein
MLIKKKSTCVALCFNFLFCILFSQQSWSTVSLEEEPVDASLPFVRAGEVVVRPMPVAIPEIALGYEEDYLRFINGKLIYKPNKDNDLGRVEISFSSLSNPLDGTFDLSECGDMVQCLNIVTGYRKGNRLNKDKFEVCIVPKFAVREYQIASRDWIVSSFTSPLGIFLRIGSWEDIDAFDHLTDQNFDELSNSENLYEKWKSCVIKEDGLEFWCRWRDFGSKPKSSSLEKFYLQF